MTGLKVVYPKLLSVFTSCSAKTLAGNSFTMDHVHREEKTLHTWITANHLTVIL